MAKSRHNSKEEVSNLSSVMDKYDLKNKIASGTFGHVYRAICKRSKRVVAVKSLKVSSCERNRTSIWRELKILQFMKHENIVELIDICRTVDEKRNQFDLVLEYCDFDLSRLLFDRDIQIPLPSIKSAMRQIFDALYILHHFHVMHRDLKPNNILVTKEGILKLTDFGYSRMYTVKEGEKKCFTPRVMHQWYRPPELLLDETEYGPEVDMWSAGCIMGEFFTRKPVLDGDENDTNHQLNIIKVLCGSIDTHNWLGTEKYQPLVNNKSSSSKKTLKERFQMVTDDENALDLIDKLLVINPQQRIDTNTALLHDFFWKEPLPDRDLREVTQQLFNK